MASIEKVHSGITIAVSLYHFHAATGKNMLVVDSKPINETSLEKSAIRKILQQRGSDSIKMDSVK